MTDPDPRLTTGVSCGHPGCLSHRSHPCEKCGRIAGGSPTQAHIDEWGKTVKEAEAALQPTKGEDKC